MRLEDSDVLNLDKEIKALSLAIKDGLLSVSQSIRELQGTCLEIHSDMRHRDEQWRRWAQSTTPPLSEWDGRDDS